MSCPETGDGDGRSVECAVLDREAARGGYGNGTHHEELANRAVFLGGHDVEPVHHNPAEEGRTVPVAEQLDHLPRETDGGFGYAVLVEILPAGSGDAHVTYGGIGAPLVIDQTDTPSALVQCPGKRNVFIPGTPYGHHVVVLVQVQLRVRASDIYGAVAQDKGIADGPDDLHILERPFLCRDIAAGIPFQIAVGHKTGAVIGEGYLPAAERRRTVRVQRPVVDPGGGVVVVDVSRGSHDDAVARCRGRGGQGARAQHPAADLARHGRDARAVERHLDVVARVPDRDAAVVGAAAHDQCAVHDDLSRLHRSRVDPVGIDGRGIFLRGRQVEDRGVGHIPDDRRGGGSLRAVQIEVMGAGKIGRAADDLVDVLLPVACAGRRGQPAARTARADTVRRPAQVMPRRNLRDNTGDEYLAVTACDTEVESPVVRRCRAGGLYLEHLLAVVGSRRVLLAGDGHHAVVGVVVHGYAVVAVPKGGVAVNHLSESHRRGQLLRRGDTRRPLRGYRRGEGDRSGGIPRDVSRRDLSRAVVVQLPLGGVGDRAVAAQRDVVLPDMVVVESPPGDTVVNLLAAALGVVGREAEIFKVIPRHHLDADKPGFDRIARGSHLPEDDMPGVAVLVPRQADTQRLVTARVPVAAARGDGADLQGRGTRRPDGPHGHVVAADGEPADLAFCKSTTQAVDICRIDDVGLDARGVQLGGVDAPGRDTVYRERPRLDARRVDVDGVHLRCGQRARVDARRADVGQRMRRERAVRALCQCDETVAADLLLDGGRKGAGCRGVGRVASALENPVRVVGYLRGRRDGRRAHEAAFDGLVGIEVVHCPRVPSAAQEDGEHAAVPAVRGSREHPAVGLRELVDVPRVADAAPAAEVGLDEQDKPAFVCGGVPRVGSLLAVSPSDQDVAFEVLLAAFENDRVIGGLVAFHDKPVIVAVPEVRRLGRLDVVLPQQGHGGTEGDLPGGVPCDVPRGDLPRAVVVQFPLRGVGNRAVAAQRDIPFGDGGRADCPSGNLVRGAESGYAGTGAVRGVKAEVRVAVVVELHALSAGGAAVRPVDRDTLVAVVQRDMGAGQR